MSLSLSSLSHTHHFHPGVDADCCLYTSDEVPPVSGNIQHLACLQGNHHWCSSLKQNRHRIVTKVQQCRTPGLPPRYQHRCSSLKQISHRIVTNVKVCGPTPGQHPRYQYRCSSQKKNSTALSTVSSYLIYPIVWLTVGAPL